MIWPLLRTRRWLGFTVVVVVAIVGFGLLSRWQWARAEEHRAERLALAASAAATPIPIDRASAPGDGDLFQAVTATGRYEPGSGVLVRRRPLDARNGFWAMTALRLADGRSVWVARGWLPATQDALATPPTPPPPSGPVTVTGYLRPMEAAAPDANEGMPTGQVNAIAPTTLPPVPDPIGGYVQLATSSPAQDDLVTLPLPSVDESRNVSYAVQWLLFAVVAVGGWYYFLRREAREDASRADAARGQGSRSEGVI